MFKKTVVLKQRVRPITDTYKTAKIDVSLILLSIFAVKSPKIPPKSVIRLQRDCVLRADTLCDGGMHRYYSAHMTVFTFLELM